jgi:hypothetical protein
MSIQKNLTALSLAAFALTNIANASAHGDHSKPSKESRKLRYLIAANGILHLPLSSSERKDKADSKAFTETSQWGAGGFLGLSYTADSGWYFSPGVSINYIFSADVSDEHVASHGLAEKLNQQLQVTPEVALGYQINLGSMKIIPLAGFKATYGLHGTEWKSGDPAFIFTGFGGLRTLLMDTLLVEATANFDINKTNQSAVYDDTVDLDTRYWSVGLRIGASL